MDSFDDFLGDDRKTVSEGFPSRKLKFPPTGIHGSKSDNGDRRMIKSSDSSKGRKGVISNRTSKMAQRALTQGGEDTPSLTSSTRSSFSATSHLSDPTFDMQMSRSQQIAEMMEASARLKLQTQRMPQYAQPGIRSGSPMEFPPRNPHSRSHSPTAMYNNANHLQSSPAVQQQLLAPSNTGQYPYQSQYPRYSYQPSPQSLSSSSPMSQYAYSANSTPSQMQLNKATRVSSPSQVYDPLVCESGDSEDGIRLADNATPSGDANTDEAYDDFHMHAPVPISTEAITLKVALVGDVKTGKSSLLHQYFDQKFNAQYSPTDGLDSRSKRSVVQGRDCKVQIWDTADSTKGREMIPSYYKGAHCFGIVFDILEYNTVETIPAWIQIIKETFSEDIPIVLIGNKLDRQGYRAVGRDSIQQYAIDCGLQGYIEVSAKSGENVSAMVDLVAFLALERYIATSPLPSPSAAGSSTSSMPSGLSSASEDALLSKYHRNKGASVEMARNGFASPLPRKKSAMGSTMDKEDPGIDLGDADDDGSIISATDNANASSSASSINLWTSTSPSQKSPGLSPNSDARAALMIGADADHRKQPATESSTSETRTTQVRAPAQTHSQVVAPDPVGTAACCVIS